MATNHLKPELIKVPPPVLGRDLAALLETGKGADVKITVEDESFDAHRIILEARSPVFHALLNLPMREGAEGVVDIKNIRPPVFKALLHFMYTDSLPEELEDGQMDAAIAQHLLEAADRYELVRLRQICENRLCQTVDVDTAATTLTLAEQNHAEVSGHCQPARQLSPCPALSLTWSAHESHTHVWMLCWKGLV